MKRFNSIKWITENKYGKLNEQDIGGDIEQSFDKDVASFTQDLEGYLNIPKVKALLDAGLADGDPNDDKISYSKVLVPVKNLTPTQNIIGFDNSVKEGPLMDKYGTLNTMFTNTPNVGGPIVTYAGKYIIDGHHRWSSVFAVNPGGNMEALNIKAKAGFQPTDILKAVHTAVALDYGSVKRSTAQSINLLDGVTYEGVLGKVEKYLSEGAAAVWAQNGYPDKVSITKWLKKNLDLIVNKGHIPDAPDRSNMPQADALGRGTEEDRIKALATGNINISPPFEPIKQTN